MNSKRIDGLDLVRGIALLFVIFFHSSIYGFANIHKIDFSNPPLIVVIMSFLTLWGGIFIIYSGFINVYKTVSSRHNRLKKLNVYTRYLFIASGIYIVLHLLLNLIFGRWANDLVNNQPNMTLVASSLRSGQFTLPSIETIYDGSSLSAIAVNLIIIGLSMRLILNSKRKKNLLRNIVMIFIIGIFLMLGSFYRIDLYHWYKSAFAPFNPVSGVFFGIMLGNPYPVLPYGIYGLFALGMGLLFTRKKNRLPVLMVMLISLLFLGYGMYGMLHNEKTISTPDYFWYFKTQFELGLFMLMILFGLWISRFRFSYIPILSWISKVSLTIYMLETLVSEIIRYLMLAIYPNFNQTINGSLLFGFINVLIWILIVSVWKTFDFKYSLEYWWVMFFQKIGKHSTKL